MVLQKMKLWRDITKIKQERNGLENLFGFS